MLNSQCSGWMCGVGPADSTGKSRVRYCPGGSSVPLRRRPANPGDTIPISATSLDQTVSGAV
jgi:hypothetical protein